MWTHQITDTGRDRGHLQVYVRFTSGERAFDEVFTLSRPTTDDWLKPQIIATIARLDGLDANEAAVVKGAIDLTPDPVEPPTDKELTALKLAKDRLAFELMAREVDRGLRKQDDAAYVALKESISKAIDAEAKAIDASPTGLKG